MSSQNPTARPDTLLNEFVASVGRAGPVFTGQATLHPDEKGYAATLQLVPNAFNQNDLGTNVKENLVRYMRLFFRSSGWRVRAVSVKRGYLALAMAASRATSRASKNL